MPFGLPEAYVWLFLVLWAVAVGVLIAIRLRRKASLADGALADMRPELSAAEKTAWEQRKKDQDAWMGILRDAAEERDRKRTETLREVVGEVRDGLFGFVEKNVTGYLQGLQSGSKEVARRIGEMQAELGAVRQAAEAMSAAVASIRGRARDVEPEPQPQQLPRWAREEFAEYEGVEPRALLEKAGIAHDGAAEVLADRLEQAVEQREPIGRTFGYLDLLRKLYKPGGGPVNGVTREMAKTAVYFWARDKLQRGPVLSFHELTGMGLPVKRVKVERWPVDKTELAGALRG